MSNYFSLQDTDATTDLASSVPSPPDYVELSYPKTHSKDLSSPSTQNDRSGLWQKKRAFYQGIIPVATRNGDFQALESAYAALIALAYNENFDPETENAISIYQLSLAASRQALGKYDLALEALDDINRNFLSKNMRKAVTYYQLKASIYLSIDRLDDALALGSKSLDLAQDLNEKQESAQNTSHFLLAVIMAKKGDEFRLEAAFYKSQVDERMDLDRAMLSKYLKDFDGIGDSKGVKISSNPSFLGALVSDTASNRDDAIEKSKATTAKLNFRLDVMVIFVLELMTVAIASSLSKGDSILDFLCGMVLLFCFAYCLTSVLHLIT